MTRGKTTFVPIPNTDGMVAETGASPSRSGAVHDPELHALALLGPDALRRRWRALMGQRFPSGLGRNLALRSLAYREQVRRFGDLDLASQRALAASLVGVRDVALGALEALNGADPLHDNSMSPQDRAVAPGSSDRARNTGSIVVMQLVPPPGTVLVREHAGALHRVMVLDEGFSWNGRTYDSLSKVAFAITGTRWNGPRFFGLRDQKTEEAGKAPPLEKTKSQTQREARHHRGIAPIGGLGAGPRSALRRDVSPAAASEDLSS